MTAAAKKVLEDALALPEEDRRRLAEAILESISTGAAEDVQQAWIDEARRRAEDVERGHGELRDLDEALVELRTELQRVRKR